MLQPTPMPPLIKSLPHPAREQPPITPLILQDTLVSQHSLAMDLEDRTMDMAPSTTPSNHNLSNPTIEVLLRVMDSTLNRTLDTSSSMAVRPDMVAISNKATISTASPTQIMARIITKTLKPHSTTEDTEGRAMATIMVADIVHRVPDMVLPVPITAADLEDLEDPQEQIFMPLHLCAAPLQAAVDLVPWDLEVQVLMALVPPTVAIQEAVWAVVAEVPDPQQQPREHQGKDLLPLNSWMR